MSPRFGGTPGEPNMAGVRRPYGIAGITRCPPASLYFARLAASITYQHNTINLVAGLVTVFLVLVALAFGYVSSSHPEYIRKVLLRFGWNLFRR